MPIFRTILCTADFSESSVEAFRVACSLAHEGETRLVVLHVAEPPILSGELGFPLPLAGDRRAIHASLETRLRESYATEPPGRVEYRTRDGATAEEILLAADELGCDLIVMGTHGRTGLGRLLMGSVAEAVLRGAKCPVLALRSPGRLATVPEEPGEVATPPIRTILHPTDFSGRSGAAFRVACSLARDHGARLIVLHAAPMATVYGGTFPGVPTDPGVYQHALEGRLRQIRIPEPEEDRPRSGDAGIAGEEPLHGSGTPGPEVRVAHRLREGDAAAEILQVADEAGADLIVMGTHGRTGLGRVLMGSVAEAVLRGARCPVLTLKSPLSETEPVSGEPIPRSITVY